MHISNENKIRLFDLALWYALPMVAVHFVSAFFANVVETSLLPSEKESWTYLIEFHLVAVLRLLAAVLVFFIYLEKGRPPFSKRLNPGNLLVGFAFGSALTGFFFGVSALRSGFTIVPQQSWLFAWEIFLFRYVPLFMVYGVALEILLNNRHSIWKQVLIATILQVIWALAGQAWDWSQGGILDWSALYPLTTVLLSIALMKKFGVYAALAALLVNSLAYQLLLIFGKFPLPDHLNSFLTMGCLVVSIRAIQNLELRPGLLRAIRSRSAEAESVQPEHG